MNEYFKIGSMMKTERTSELEDIRYPDAMIDVLSASYRYYTSKQKAYINEGETI